jgi:hypothetical protein
MAIDYLQYIYRVYNLLTISGCSVDLFATKLDNRKQGECDYSKQKIKINCPKSKDALYTLVHESGHWFSYLYNKKIEDVYTPSQRERLAFIFGWKLIKILEIPIDITSWKGYFK